MTTHDTPVRLEDLLAHRAWVRGLAVALTRDEADADDVVQQTWLAALRRPPRTAASPRGWLATVVRNAVREHGRRSARRTRRETVVATHESSESTDDPAELTARAELHAAVAAAVVALAEPYRRAILLRHFDELPVAEVAGRMGTPLETTRARLRRGRAMLRERLAGDYGDDRPLAVLLLPLTKGKTPAVAGVGAAVAAGGLAMTGKIVIGAATVLLLGLGVWWGTRDRDVGAPDETALVPLAESRPAPRPIVTPTARVRVQTPPTSADGPVPVEEDVEGPTDPPARPSIAERLDREFKSIDYADRELREILAEISADLDVPVYAHADPRLHLTGDEALVNLKLSPPVTGRDLLRLLTSFRGLALDVLVDRIVVRRADAESTTPDTPTVLIPPAVRDPNAPTTVRVRVRVLHADGRPAVGARVAGQGVPPEFSAVADVAGYVEFATAHRSLSLVAAMPFYEKSVVWTGKGDLGELVEPELVLGPPAGAIDVTVSSGDAPVASARVSVSWGVPGQTMRVRSRDGVREVPARRGISLATAADGTGSNEHVRAGSVTVRVTLRGYAPAEQTADVVAGERTRLAFDLRATTLAARMHDERISFAFTDATAREVVAFIGTSRRMSLVVGPDAAELFQTAAVSLTVKDRPIDEALRELLRAVSPRLTVDVNEDSGVVFIHLAPE